MSWKKVKRPPILRPQKVQCPHCHRLVWNGNFCCVCTHRLRYYCKCPFFGNMKWRCRKDGKCHGYHTLVEILEETKRGDFRRYKEVFPESFAKYEADRKGGVKDAAY